MAIRFALFICMASVSLGAKAETIGERLAKHPEQFEAIIKEKDYSKQLQFIKDAYAEHQANPKDAVDEYVYGIVMGSVPSDHQIALALDFALNQSDMEIRRQSADAIYHALAHNVLPDETTRVRLSSKLKQDLATLTKPSQTAFQLASCELDTLMLLGDDAGLDGYLTETYSVREMSVVDKWEIDSEPTLFDQLATKYAKEADDQHADWPNSCRTDVAMYRLAKERRLRGIKIEPLHPLVDLDKLLAQ